MKECDQIVAKSKILQLSHTFHRNFELEQLKSKFGTGRNLPRTKSSKKISYIFKFSYIVPHFSYPVPWSLYIPKRVLKFAIFWLTASTNLGYKQEATIPEGFSSYAQHVQSLQCRHFCRNSPPLNAENCYNLSKMQPHLSLHSRVGSHLGFPVLAPQVEIQFQYDKSCSPRHD